MDKLNPYILNVLQGDPFYYNILPQLNTIDIYNLMQTCRYYKKKLYPFLMKKITKTIILNLANIFNENTTEFLNVLMQTNAVITGEFITNCVLESEDNDTINIVVPIKLNKAKKIIDDNGKLVNCFLSSLFVNTKYNNNFCKYVNSKYKINVKTVNCVAMTDNTFSIINDKIKLNIYDLDKIFKKQKALKTVSDLVKALSYEYDDELGSKANKLRVHYNKMYTERINKLKNQQKHNKLYLYYENVVYDDKMEQEYGAYNWCSVDCNKYISFYHELIFNDDDNNDSYGGDLTPIGSKMEWGVVLEFYITPEYSDTISKVEYTDEYIPLLDILIKYPEAICLLGAKYGYSDILNNLK